MKWNLTVLCAYVFLTQSFIDEICAFSIYECFILFFLFLTMKDNIIFANDIDCLTKYEIKI